MTERDYTNFEQTFPSTHGHAVRDYVAQFTVAWCITTSTADDGEFVDSGSGVLVRLLDKYFILTAGHCVTARRSENWFVSVQAAHHRFSPFVIKSGHRWIKEDHIDFGYWEIPDADANTIKAASRSFLPERRLEVLSESELTELSDYVCVHGYPDQLTAKKTGVLGLTSMFYMSGNESDGRERAGLRPFEPSGPHLLLMEVDKAGNIDLDNSEEPARDLPSLAGVSGGGVWRTHANSCDEDWTSEELRLVGTHIGRAPRENSKPGDVFGVGTLIGHHLALISDDYPELSAELSRLWPNLATFPV